MSATEILENTLEAIQAAPDMELAGIVRISGSIKSMNNEIAKEIMSKGICTVDSFDIHGDEMLK